MENQLNIWEILWHASFVVKLVVFFLASCSVYCWAIILFKFKTVKRMKENNREFLLVYKSDVPFNTMAERCRGLDYSPFQYVFNKTYQEINSFVKQVGGPEHMGEYVHRFGMDFVERALHQSVNEVQEKSGRFLPVLASVGSLSPFVGLFGTVWGIVNSFTSIARSGATLETVAPGIAEALVATAIGLVVAIPAVLFYNYFIAENTKMDAQVEAFCQDYLNLMERQWVLERS